MAWLSPSRYPLYCGLWVPGGRTEPFFPLRSRRSRGLTRPQNATPIPSSGFARCARSGITPGLSLPFGKPLPGFCCGNSQVVLFVELPFYNTVVLMARPKTRPDTNPGRIRLSDGVAGSCAPAWASPPRQPAGRGRYFQLRRNSSTSPALAIRTTAAIPMNKPCSTTPGISLSARPSATGSGIWPKWQSRM